MEWSSRGRWAAGAVGVAVVGCAAAVALLGRSGSDPRPQVRARQYTARQACLLTDARGLAAPQAAAVWAGMEDASLATRGKVMYLATQGPGTAGNAVPYANSLLQRHCDVILAVGGPQTAGLAAVAHSPTAPAAARFVLVGGQGRAAGRNVTRLPESSGVRTQVAQLVEAVLRQ